MFRALLFGFEDVHELSEDVWTPLCNDGNWLRGFAKVAGEVLELIQRSEKNVKDMEEFDTVTVDPEEVVESEEPSWPPVQQDTILQNLISRNGSQNVNLKSLNEHRSLVGAVSLAADALWKLDQCVPEYSEIFLQNSLFSDEPKYWTN